MLAGVLNAQTRFGPSPMRIIFDPLTYINRSTNYRPLAVSSREDAPKVQYISGHIVLAQNVCAI